MKGHHVNHQTRQTRPRMGRAQVRLDSPRVRGSSSLLFNLLAQISTVMSGLACSSSPLSPPVRSERVSFTSERPLNTSSRHMYRQVHFGRPRRQLDSPHRYRDSCVCAPYLILTCGSRQSSVPWSCLSRRITRISVGGTVEPAGRVLPRTVGNWRCFYGSR